MADPVLTTLCAVCHTTSPIYKCPRDGTPTCSRKCCLLHKKWASCSGIRDVTKYVPLAELRTPRYYDHDYNLIHNIETARDRGYERELLERRVVTRRELQPSMRGTWIGDQLRFVEPNVRGPGRHRPPPREEGDGATAAKRRARKWCRQAGVEVISVPKGMSRQRDDGTTWNNRTMALNWQVEWMVYEEGTDKPPTRILRKLLDEVPIYQGFASTMEWVIKGVEAGLQTNDDGSGPSRRRRHRHRHRHHRRDEDWTATAAQSGDATWTQTPWPLQNPFTGSWDMECGSEMTTWKQDADFAQKRKFRFFLLKPRSKPKELIPLESDETLRELLPGRTILEFPTLYVLPPDAASLPADHILGSVERRKNTDLPQSDESDSEDDEEAKEEAGLRGKPKKGAHKRRRSDDDAVLEYTAGPESHSAKRRAVPLIQEVDDGEINSEGEDVPGAASDVDMDEDSDTSSEGSTSSEDDDNEESEDSEDSEREDDNTRDVEMDEMGDTDKPEPLMELLNVKAASSTAKLGLIMYDSDDE